jgi:hypothetical protein
MNKAQIKKTAEWFDKNKNLTEEIDGSHFGNGLLEQTFPHTFHFGFMRISG